VTLFPEPHHLRFWYGTDELFVRQVNIDPPENIVTATLQPSHGARQTRAGDFLILDVVEPAKTTQHVLQVTVAVHEETGTIVRARCLGPTARPSLVKPSDPREAELWATNLDPELHQGLTPEEVRDRTEDGRNRIFPSTEDLTTQALAESPQRELESGVTTPDEARRRLGLPTLGTP
jgi:hypothetical protein